MWNVIRSGVRWRPQERLSLATRALDLAEVKSVRVSFDPFDETTASLRTFWYILSHPRVKATNPALRVTEELRDDRSPPFFEAHLKDGRIFHFDTQNMPTADMIMHLNHMLGNPVIGKCGIRPPYLK